MSYFYYSLEEIQAILSRSAQLILDILKHVALWGQSRHLSFDLHQEEPFYKENARISESERQVYERLQTHETIGQFIILNVI